MPNQAEILTTDMATLASHFELKKDTPQIPYFINQDHVNRIITILKPGELPKVTIQIDNQNDLELAKLFCNILNENL